MFKRRAEDSGKNSLFQFAFKIFFVHIVNIIVLLVLSFLFVTVDSLGLSVSEQFTSIVITVVCMVLYLVMIYLEGWRRGERDYNLVLYKHMEEQKLRGFWAGLISQIPGLICAILILFPSIDFSVERLARYFYINCNYLFTKIDEGASPFVYHLCYFLPAVIAPVVVGAAYQLGYKRYRLADRLIWVTPKEKKDDKKRRDLR